jgi:hypothetical protein
MWQRGKGRDCKGEGWKVEWKEGQQESKKNNAYLRPCRQRNCEILACKGYFKYVLIENPHPSLDQNVNDKLNRKDDLLSMSFF